MVGGELVQRHALLAAIVEPQGDHKFRDAIMRRGQVNPADRAVAHARAIGGSMKITSLGRIGLADCPGCLVERMKT